MEEISREKEDTSKLTTDELIERANSERLVAAIEAFTEGSSNSLLLKRKPFQRPTHTFVPDLYAEAWHNKEDYEWIAKLEENYEEIKNEFLSVYNQTEEGEKFDKVAANVLEGGKWRKFDFVDQGRVVEENCKKCPLTWNLLQEIPVAIGTGVCYAYFSIVHSGTVITPHCGPVNFKTRFHLALIVPQTDCFIQVGQEKRSWEEGKVLIFDDSFIHRVEHKVRSFQKTF